MAMNTCSDRLPTAARPTESGPAGPALGLLLAFGVAGIAVLACALVPVTLSPLLVGIVAGAVLANLGWVPEVTRPGLAVAGRRVLRIGIVLLGLQLAVGDVLGLGWTVVLGAVVIVAGGITATVVAGRALGVRPSQALLIGCGFSICGAAAVAAADGVVADREEEETATAIALVVLFGTGMIALVPALSHVTGLGQHAAGVLAGGSIHEVGQVVAAGGLLGEQALTTAVLVKLTRVLMLAPVLVVLAAVQRRTAAGPARRDGQGRPPFMPLFVAGFLALVALRSTGVVPAEVVAGAQLLETVTLTAAMFALGASVHLGTLRRTGGGPLLLAAVSTTVVTALAFGLAIVA